MPTVDHRVARDPAAAGAETAVGQFLSCLGARWRVVHDVPFAELSESAHLAVGPPGVFVVVTRHHPGAVVRLAGDDVAVDGFDRPHVRATRQVADAASALLPEPVRGVLAVSGARVVTSRPAPPDVDVLEAHELVRHLRSRPESLDRAAVERIYDVARNLATWQLGLDPLSVTAARVL